MSHDLLQDSRFQASLTLIDRGLTEKVRQGGCPACDGVLHTANYPRKPRGLAELAVDSDWAQRLSLCCGRDGCRKRATPPSVRFAGRLVYVGLAFVWACASIGKRVSVADLEEVREAIGVSARTMGRWIAWWRRILVQGTWWPAARARFLPPVDETLLPASLLERFCLPDRGPMEMLLHYMAPLSTRSVHIV